MTLISVVRALYAYEAAAEDELGFAEGAILGVLEQEHPDEEWFLGFDVTAPEHTGLIPKTYVETVLPSLKLSSLLNNSYLSVVRDIGRGFGALRLCGPRAE
jgi:hypothetical protein